ncbi:MULTISPECIES: MmyB family transcriptional regulator [unclassified Pseudarthrobacter]|uniref:MmyB family transcriptional regulator n=1 Tax=unclassified Pseudarthrobacter TaxID=2647000 RepID=UPI0030771851
MLRSHAGRRPHHKSLTDLIGELATRSDEFRKRWAKHNVPVPPDRHQAAEPSGGRRAGAQLRAPQTARQLGGDSCKRAAVSLSG